MVCAALVYPQFWLNHDSSWYLVATRMFLDGKQLYVDIVEINPPLAFYLTVPSLYLADLTGMSETISFMAFCIVLGGFSVIWLICIVLRTSLARPAQAIFILVPLFGIYALPAADFGQREQLFLILALPYFSHLLLSEQAKSVSLLEKLALGVCAALGLALKPYFLLIPCLIILAGPVKTLLVRVFDPANLAIAASLAAYLIFILTVHPEYVSEIVPIANLVYSSYGSDARGVLLQLEFYALGFFIALYVIRGCLENRL